jgi:hypothetical protein
METKSASQTTKNDCTDAKTCFVIMPFSRTYKARTKEYWTNHYEKLLKPLIISCNVKVSRSEPLRQNILREIIHKLVFSDIVIADLTDGNPNVYWELGVRQSFRHCTITVIDETSKKISYEASKKIPFDIAGKSILTYSATDLNKHSFSELFKKAIFDCLENPKLPDSEVLESITGRTSIYQVIHQEEIRQKIEGLIFENNANHSTLERIMKRVEENKNRKGIIKKSTRTIALTHMSNSAINLLLTERYLEENEKFYVLANHILNLISAVNQNVSTWQDAYDSVEGYFLENYSSLDLLLKQYQQKLIELREKAKKFS